MVRKLAPLCLAFATTVAALAPALAALAPQPSIAQSAAGECLTFGAMQEALLDGRARRLAEIRRMLEGDIVKADLCLDEGKLSYRVTVLTRDGQVKKVVLDASSGQFMYDKR
ncbi:PepSY domain-containing protein [Prosthecomicrobium sp. N25]|uniref:PepSY domain-containing protein n=1 Tax=Prosthecomicrobium sp. N25 TaxID=3129254 RepID=UPI003078A5DB